MQPGRHKRFRSLRLDHIEKTILERVYIEITLAFFVSAIGHIQTRIQLIYSQLQALMQTAQSFTQIQQGQTAQHNIDQTPALLLSSL